MIGWAGFALVAAATLLLLWRISLRDRNDMTFALAAVMLAAAGYAWQGSPWQGEARARSSTARPVTGPELPELRAAMTGRFGGDQQWLIFSDALLRAGSTQNAITAIRSGLRENPNSLALWTALGSALVTHDGGQVSPAARLAFARAAGIDRASPAPDFFLGLGEVRAGDLAAAERHWQRALALTPADADYRREVAARLSLLRVLRAAQTRQGVTPPTP